jgi:hypothetical protein
MNEQNPLLTLSLHDQKQAIALKEQIEGFQAQLAHLLGGTGSPTATQVVRKRTMSASARARIAAAQRERWAKIHAAKAPAGKAPAKRRRKASAAARARLSALAKARWAKIKKAGGKGL